MAGVLLLDIFFLLPPPTANLLSLGRLWKFHCPTKRKYLADESRAGLSIWKKQYVNKKIQWYVFFRC